MLVLITTFKDWLSDTCTTVAGLSGHWAIWQYRLWSLDSGMIAILSLRDFFFYFLTTSAFSRSYSNHISTRLCHVICCCGDKSYPCLVGIGISLYWKKIFSVSHYCKIASSNTSRLEAHAGFFRLLMNWIFGPYVLWPFDKKLIF